MAHAILETQEELERGPQVWSPCGLTGIELRVARVRCGGPLPDAGLFEKGRDGPGVAPPSSLSPFSYLGLFVCPRHGLGCPKSLATSALLDSPWVWLRRCWFEQFEPEDRGRG